MTDFRHQIHALIDPDHTELLPSGNSRQQVSVIMTNFVPIDEHADPWLAPAAIMLRPEEARELARELLLLADQAEHAEIRR